MDVESQKLTSQFLDHTLTADQLAEFEARLLRDDAFARDVARWSLLHRQVLDVIEEGKLHGLMDLALPGMHLLPIQFAADSRHAARQRGWRRGWYWAIPVAAAAVLALIALAGRLAPPGDSHDQAVTHMFAESAPGSGDDGDRSTEEWSTSAATLMRVSDCQWSSGSAPFEPGQRLASGTRLTLDAGLAKLTFECGAEIVLQGPCDFSVVHPMRGFLHAGKLTANVPPRAFAFSISSPGVDFADLGTEFGVSVGKDATAELHVFSGEVIYRMDADTRQSNEIVRLEEEKAVRLSPNGGGEESIHLNREMFQQHSRLRQNIEPAPTLPITRDLTLWLSAGRGVDVDANQRVIAWHDTVCSDNVVGEDAVQSDPLARPQLVLDAVQGQPGIRFDGMSSHMVTTPIESTSDQTVIILCQFSPEAYRPDRKYGGQILNYDGPPSRELSNTFKPGILQIGEPLLEEEFLPTRVTGQVFAGFAGKATIEAGRIDGCEVGAANPIVLAYRYDYTHRRSHLYVDGVLQGEGDAFAPAALTSRKVIGRHAWMELFFHGDLAELLIYNAALSDEQVATMTEYLQIVYALK